MTCRLVGVVVVCTVCLLGCGAAKPTPLSRAVFVNRADAVCKQQRAAFITTVERERLETMSRERASLRAMNLTSTSLRRELAGFERLTPPKGLQDTFDGYKKQIAASAALQPKLIAARGSRTFEEVHRAIHTAGSHVYDVYQQAGLVNGEMRKLGAKIGFKVCSA